MRAIADHRLTLLRDRCEDELARRACRLMLSRNGIDALDDDMVLVHMHAVLLGALERNARTCDLSEAVDVVCVDAEDLFELAAHLLGPRLGTEDAALELQVATRLQAHLASGFAQVDGVGRRAAQHGRAELAHHHDLALRVAARHRDDHRTDLRCALRRAETARDQAVAVGDLDDVVLRRTCCDHRAGDHVSPHLHIALRVAGYDRMARGA